MAAKSAAGTDARLIKAANQTSVWYFYARLRRQLGVNIKLKIESPAMRHKRSERNRNIASGLARILHEGNEEQGKSGKQGWSIARRFIAIAMGESDKGKDPVDLFPDERVAHG